MKIFIRGGVWTNVEDQVLLAAYMKYGGNQWLRIASLLPRKTASQVKARWEEYLDPTLRKTPWTQHEDEKLLHLARLMPMQWRTISQYFGRSAYQCVERYRELVDKASATPHYDDNDAAVIHEMMPNFETLNAVPDPVELDQDEKEMLAEARARLANTQGKKARRKARERQLDVMRKIVKLRKKRELVAAGIILEEKNMWEDKEFEVDVLTTHEAKKVKFDTTIDDEIAKQERIRRIKKKVEERKKAKEIKSNQKVEKPDLIKDLGHLKEELIKEEAKLDQPYDSKHTDLMLPEPQIDDSELRSIEILRHSNTDFFEQPRSLSLLRYTQAVEESWNTEQEIEEEPYKTKAVINDLPRPFPVSTMPLYLNDYTNKQTISFEDIAEELVVEETIRLAYHDAYNYKPSKIKSNPKQLLYPADEKTEKHYSHLEDIQPIDLLKAQKLINDEIAGTVPDYDSFIQCWDEMHQNNNESLELLDLDLMIEKEEKKVIKLRNLYMERTKNSDTSCHNLLTKLNNEILDLYKLAREKEMYKEIRDAEFTMIQVRIETLTEKIKKLEEEQIAVDIEYKRVIQEKKEASRKAKK